MRKVYLLSLVLGFTLCMTACKSTKEPVDANASQKDQKKNYVGWVDATAKDIVAQKGIVQYTVKPTLGSYNIKVQNSKDKFIPVLSTVDEFSSSALYLKTSKTTYKLFADGNIKTGVSKTETGLKITYVINNVAEITVNLDTLQSSSENDFDMVRTTVTVTNKGQKKDTFALKQVLDTVLGETGAFHFYTSDNAPVKNEVMFRNPVEQKWVMSKNNSAAMQIFFTGADSTDAEIAALANYSTLVKAGWEPDMLSFRTFDTVLSYNNSAVGIIWPAVKILPKESKKFVYYMAFATDGETPNGEEYVYGKVVYREPVPAIPTLVEQNPVEPVSPKVEVQPVEKKLPPVEKEVYTPKEIPNVEFNVNNLSKEQFTPEYIQNLLDRIAVLERSSASVNREELLKLNTELDAILSALRQ